MDIMYGWVLNNEAMLWSADHSVHGTCMHGSCTNMHENHKHSTIITPTVSAQITVSQNITTEKLSVAVQRGNCALIGLVWVLNNSVLPACIALYVAFVPLYFTSKRVL